MKWFKFQNPFSFDYRSLALMRIGIGLTLILDLIDRARDIGTHYADMGILPRLALFQYQNEWLLSLHTISGSVFFEGFLFILAGIFAMMLMVGYRTTLASIASLILLLSLQNRNPLVLQGGDVIFRVVLFWGMFLPWGARFSIDRIQGRIKAPLSREYRGMPAYAYLIQIMLIYIFSALLKTGIPWQTGTAAYFALSIDQFTRPFGYYLLQFPTLLQYLSFGALYTEFFAPFLFISPLWNGLLRTLGVFALMALHIGINLSMSIGLFGMIGFVTLLGLLPAWFWDSIIGGIRIPKKQGLKIYYDGYCSFCKNGVSYIKRALFLHRDIPVMSAYSDETIKKLMDEHNSWVIIDGNGNSHFGFDGFITILSYSPFFSWLKPILKISYIERQGEKLYHEISIRRPRMCKREKPEKIIPAKVFAKKVRNGIIVILIIYVGLWNIDQLPTKHKIIPESWKPLAWTTGLDQRFDMFAPNPATEDGWYVIPAQLKNGTEFDLYTQKSLTYDKPEYVARTYSNQRWQKYMMNLWSKDNSKYRLYYGQYLCREWNGAHVGQQQVTTFKIIYMLEITNLNKQEERVVPTVIWEHKC